MLDPEAQAALDRRKLRGEQAINVHPDYPSGIDTETAASDIISDTLTFLFGPSGAYSYGGTRSDDGDARQNAKDFLARAFRSWKGDAEDYYRKPEPGEYGYEEAEPC